jgi:hypothetical protein
LSLSQEPTIVYLNIRQAIYKYEASYFVLKSSSTRDEIVFIIESIVSNKKYDKNGHKE